MTSDALHRCRVAATPWPGVHAVHTSSVRSFGRHAHETHGIGLLAAGAHRSASGRGPVDAYAGDLLSCNPGEVHDGRPMGQGGRRWHMLHLDAPALAAWSGRAEAAGLLAWRRPVFRDARVHGALQQLFHRLDDWSTAARAADVLGLACEESLVALGGLLAPHATMPPPDADGHAGGACPDPAIARVRDRLADEAACGCASLADLAAAAGLSRYQLLRRFARCYGLPPHAWLLQQRAERARRLIRDGRPLGDAALAAGFADQSHMTRIFQRQFGFTPGAWQRAQPAGRPQ